MTYTIGKCDWGYRTWLMLFQAQYIVVGQVSDHPIAGEAFLNLHSTSVKFMQDCRINWSQ